MISAKNKWGAHEDETLFPAEATVASATSKEKVIYCFSGGRGIR